MTGLICHPTRVSENLRHEKRIPEDRQHDHRQQPAAPLPEQRIESLGVAEADCEAAQLAGWFVAGHER
ncbi:hypothetical protein V6O07_14625, partial [Arthrospira platensis SPKY2]